MIRTFLALPLPRGIRRYLSELCIPIMDSRDKINWVKPANIHITLAFLGDTEEKLLEEQGQRIQELVAAATPFELELDETGVFPHANDPKILWTGAIPFSNDLTNLRNDLNIILSQMGYRVDNRSFQPHITLGRVKSISRKSSFIHDFLVTDVRATQFTIDSITWFKSTLTQVGAEYEAIRTFNFKQGE